MDLFNMMGKFQQVQDKIKIAQENAGILRTEGEAGGGMVKVTVNGNRKIIKVDIDDSIMDDKEMVQDLIVAAANIALNKIEELIKESISKQMEGVIPNIPGIDLSQFLK